jgi:hypothetical protein
VGDEEIKRFSEKETEAKDVELAFELLNKYRKDKEFIAKDIK